MSSKPVIPKLEEFVPRCKTKDTDDFPELLEHKDVTEIGSLLELPTVGSY